MTSLDWNLDNFCLKCTNFRLYIFFANFGWFYKIKYTQSFLPNSILENKYTLSIHEIHISWNTWKNIHKINSAKFLESVSNRSILNQCKFLPACFSVDLDRNISRISFYSTVFLFGPLKFLWKFRNLKFSKLVIRKNKYSQNRINRRKK